MVELPRKKKAAVVALINIVRIVNAKTRANSSSLTPSSSSLSSSFREEEEEKQREP